MTHTKVCGMTRLDDVQAAVEAGVDAIGCLVGLDYDTPDRVEPEAARAIFASVPPFVSTVLVTHRTGTDEVASLLLATGAVVVQLHGDFPLEAIPELRRRVPHVSVVVCTHVVSEASIEEALGAAEVADRVLLDSRTANRIGGTGRTHDWSISARIVKRSRKPVILAGGLSPENVAEAIARVQPWGVDVNSGVRGTDGVKSHARIRAFVAAAKGHGIR